MKEMYRPKEQVLERLQTLIEEEETCIVKTVDEYIAERRRKHEAALTEFRKDVLDDKSVYAGHLRTLKELYRRFKDDTRDALPLDHDEFEIIIDGRGGGAEQMALAAQEEKIRRVQANQAATGAVIMRALRTMLLRDDPNCPQEACDDPNCPIHAGGFQEAPQGVLAETPPEETDNLADGCQEENTEEVRAPVDS